VKTKLIYSLTPFAILGAIILPLAPLTSARAASGTALGARKAPASPAPDGQALAGTWKLNRAQSDDPAKKLVSDDNISTGDTGTIVPLAGQVAGRPDNNSQNGSSVGGPPAGSLGAPGGMSGVGGLTPGPMSMPATPPSHRWETDKDRQKKLEGLLPAGSLNVVPKDNELDFVDDQDHKQIFYTDGRKLPKSKDDKLQQFDARWENGHLTYDEKRPPHGVITRAFELSLDGRQMTETMTIDNGSIAVPVVLKYVYDATPATAQK
jgi:hypothetical protein